MAASSRRVHNLSLVYLLVLLSFNAHAHTHSHSQPHLPHSGSGYENEDHDHGVTTGTTEKDDPKGQGDQDRYSKHKHVKDEETGTETVYLTNDEPLIPEAIVKKMKVEDTPELITHRNLHKQVVNENDHQETIITKIDGLKKGKITPAQDKFTLWVTALGSTAMISCAPILILLLIPLDNNNTKKQQPLLRVLLSFASGGLLGDAFLHLIPHAINPHSHQVHSDDHSHSDLGHSHDHSHSEHGHSHADKHSHQDMFVGLWVLAGIVAFLCVEKFVRYVKGGHGHCHGNGSSSYEKDDAKLVDNPILVKDIGSQLRLRKKSDTAEEEKIRGKRKRCSMSEGSSEIAVAGYLNLVADFSHNFTDGLAVGASYLVGHNLGIVTTITILLHEVPHEIGDFAILVQSGYSKKKAMLLQFSTAIGAMAGTVCSLLAQDAGATATSWILPFTAGGFIYIATVSVIPQLLQDSKPLQTFKEIIALVIGVYMMVLIAEYE